MLLKPLCVATAVSLVAGSAGAWTHGSGSGAPNPAPVLNTIAAVKIGVLTPTKYGGVDMDSPYWGLLNTTGNGTATNWCISETDSNTGLGYWQVKNSSGVYVTLTATPVCAADPNAVAPSPTAAGAAAQLGGAGITYTFQVTLQNSNGYTSAPVTVPYLTVAGAASFSDIDVSRESGAHDFMRLLLGGSPAAFLTAGGNTLLMSTGSDFGGGGSASGISFSEADITTVFTGTSYRGWIDDGADTGCTPVAPDTKCYDGVAGHNLHITAGNTGTPAVGQDVLGAPGDGADQGTAGSGIGGIVKVGTTVTSGTCATAPCDLTVNNSQAVPPCSPTGVTPGCMWATSVRLTPADTTRNNPVKALTLQNSLGNAQVAYVTADGIPMDDRDYATGGGPLMTQMFTTSGGINLTVSAAEHVAVINSVIGFHQADYTAGIDYTVFSMDTTGVTHDIAFYNDTVSYPVFGLEEGGTPPNGGEGWDIAFSHVLFRDVLSRAMVIFSPINIGFQDTFALEPLYWRPALHMDALQINAGGQPLNLQMRRFAVMQLGTPGVWQQAPFMGHADRITAFVDDGLSTGCTPAPCFDNVAGDKITVLAISDTVINRATVYNLGGQLVHLRNWVKTATSGSAKGGIGQYTLYGLYGAVSPISNITYGGSGGVFVYPANLTGHIKGRIVTGIDGNGQAYGSAGQLLVENSDDVLTDTGGYVDSVNAVAPVGCTLTICSVTALTGSASGDDLTVASVQNYRTPNGTHQGDFIAGSGLPGGLTACYMGADDPNGGPNPVVLPVTWRGLQLNGGLTITGISWATGVATFTVGGAGAGVQVGEKFVTANIKYACTVNGQPSECNSGYNGTYVLLSGSTSTTLNATLVKQPADTPNQLGKVTCGSANLSVGSESMIAYGNGNQVYTNLTDPPGLGLTSPANNGFWPASPVTATWQSGFTNGALPSNGGNAQIILGATFLQASAGPDSAYFANGSPNGGTSGSSGCLKQHTIAQWQALSNAAAIADEATCLEPQPSSALDGHGPVVTGSPNWLSDPALPIAP